MVIGQDEVKRRLGTKTLYFQPLFVGYPSPDKKVCLNNCSHPVSKPAEINSYIMKLTKLKSALLILGLCGTMTLSPIANTGHAAQSPIAIAKQLNEAFVQVVEKVSPSVVVVKVTQKRDTSGRLQQFRGNPFFEFFEEEMGERFRERLEERQRQMPAPQGQGSGVIIRKDGYIVTNRHVVEDAEFIKVLMQDGTEYKASVKGLDPESDLAVIKIDASNLPATGFADSDKTRVGEFAIAIGAPFELDYSVTIGHVSAKGRSIYASPDQFDADFIQTDASINPGNSGGPLVNLDGKIVGINTMIRGIGTGIGFAIPSNLVREISESLIQHGKVTRAWLGIRITSLREEPALRRQYKNVKDGVIVTDIESEGPSAKSALEVDDIIVAVEGKNVATVQQLKNQIRSKKIGAPLTLTVNRSGKSQDVKVRPGELPSMDELRRMSMRGRQRGNTDIGEKIGIKVEQLNESLARKNGIESGSAVVVTEVAEGGPAESNNISAGDIITHINGNRTSTLSQMREAISDADLEEGIVIKLISDGSKKLRILRNR